MLAHGDDPLIDRQIDRGPALFLVSAVVGENTVGAVKVGGRGAQLGLVLCEILICLLVGYQIDRVLQNIFDGEAGEVPACLGLDILAAKLGLGFGEGVGLGVEREDFLDQLSFLRDKPELAGFAALAVHGDGLHALRAVAGGGVAPQPASGFSQLVHVVPDALGDGLPL